MTTTTIKHMVGAVVAAVLVVFIAAKCDVDTFRLRTSDWDDSVNRGALSEFNGAIVKLERVSSRCDEDIEETLIAQVGLQMEFPAESVVNLHSPCAAGPAVELDVDVEGQSIVYDFCNVTEAGRFPNAEFESFVITDVFHILAPIRGVTIDWGETTLDMSEEAISFDEHTVKVNLAGLEYDETCRVKLAVILETDPEATKLVQD
ncbi:MAG: hypothetical protein WBN15_17700 [Polyangiales bacterium]